MQKAYTLWELNNLVRLTIEGNLIGGYWVEAELSECRENRGHCYMELIEKEEGSNTPIARARAVCWRNVWAVLRSSFERVTGQSLHVGMKVMLQVSPQFHEAFGFSWIVDDINPEFTLGDMARRRQEIISQLKAEGVFDLQRELDMIDTNVTAVHILMKLFLKDFTQRGSGYIMNIASSAGLMNGGPYMSTYYATKAYVADLTSAVARELEEQGSRVKVCALCPGPVDTEFNEVAGCSFGVKAISAKQCSDEAVKGMFGGKTIIVPSATLKLAAAGAHIVPRKLLVALTGRVQSQKGDV